MTRQRTRPPTDPRADIAAALRELTRAVRRLGPAQGRIARRNARRATLGALRAARLRLDRDFPQIDKPAAPPEPPIDRAARRQTWREFEHYTIRNVQRHSWDRAEAGAFNIWIAAHDAHEAKPIRFDRPDWNSRARRFIGLHCTDAIYIRPGLPAPAKWRTLLHEIAHYRESGHGRAFVRELARVYRLWLDFRRTRGTADHDTTTTP